MPSSPSILRKNLDSPAEKYSKIEFFSPSAKIGHGKAEAPTAAAIIDDVEKKSEVVMVKTKTGKKKKLSLMYSEARRELSMKNTTSCVCVWAKA